MERYPVPVAVEVLYRCVVKHEGRSVGLEVLASSGQSSHSANAARQSAEAE